MATYIVHFNLQIKTGISVMVPRDNPITFPAGADMNTLIRGVGWGVVRINTSQWTGAKFTMFSGSEVLLLHFQIKQCCIYARCI